MVEDLTPDLMPVDGDALVPALQMAGQMLAKSGVPGSVLVITDGVSPSQIQALSAMKFALPVQFLSMHPPNADVDSGLQSAATRLKAAVIKLTVDQADVEKAARGAQSGLRASSATGDGARWQDAGYALLPLLAFVLLMWSRKGWVVR
jgi:Ca-activated chloride channel family protein